MQKSMEGMQISINEKEAEIIRLNMCLGDEKKRNSDMLITNKVSERNTPKRSNSK